MRLSREAKAEHYEEITTSASAMLRERGIDGTSLADLMQSVGLTHGGFYRHFKSKEELVAISAFRAFESVQRCFAERTAKMGAKEALKAYLREYLSPEHRDDPAAGCIVAACGTDAARHDTTLQNVFTAGMRGMLHIIKAGLSGPSRTRADRAVELVGLMVGTMVMARATNDEAMSDSLLASARRRALQMVDEECE